MLSEKPWRLEATLKLLLLVLFSWFAGQMLAGLAEHVLGKAVCDQWGVPVIIITLMAEGLALGWVALFLREHGLGWAEGFGFKNGPARAVLLGAGVALIVVPCTLTIHTACVELLTWLHVDVEDQQAVQLLIEAQTPFKITYMGFATILLAPVAEEMIFRGILYPQLKNLGYPRLALWIVSSLFALAHMNLAAFLPLVFLAVMLALLYEWTNNLLACIVVHSLFNAANFGMLFFLKNSGQL